MAIEKTYAVIAPFNLSLNSERRNTLNTYIQSLEKEGSVLVMSPEHASQTFTDKKITNPKLFNNENYKESESAEKYYESLAVDYLKKNTDYAKTEENKNLLADMMRTARTLLVNKNKPRVDFAIVTGDSLPQKFAREIVAENDISNLDIDTLKTKEAFTVTFKKPSKTNVNDAPEAIRTAYPGLSSKADFVEYLGTIATLSQVALKITSGDPLNKLIHSFENSELIKKVPSVLSNIKKISAENKELLLVKQNLEKSLSAFAKYPSLTKDSFDDLVENLEKLDALTVNTYSKFRSSKINNTEANNSSTENTLLNEFTYDLWKSNHFYEDNIKTQDRDTARVAANLFIDAVYGENAAILNRSEVPNLNEFGYQSFTLFERMNGGERDFDIETLAKASNLYGIEIYNYLEKMATQSGWENYQEWLKNDPSWDSIQGFATRNGWPAVVKNLKNSKNFTLCNKKAAEYGWKNVAKWIENVEKAEINLAVSLKKNIENETYEKTKKQALLQTTTAHDFKTKLDLELHGTAAIMEDIFKTKNSLFAKSTMTKDKEFLEFVDDLVGCNFLFTKSRVAIKDIVGDGNLGQGKLVEAGLIANNKNVLQDMLFEYSSLMQERSVVNFLLKKSNYRQIEEYDEVAFTGLALTDEELKAIGLSKTKVLKDIQQLGALGASRKLKNRLIEISKEVEKKSKDLMDSFDTVFKTMDVKVNRDRIVRDAITIDKDGKKSVIKSEVFNSEIEGYSLTRAIYTRARNNLNSIANPWKGKNILDEKILKVTDDKVRNVTKYMEADNEKRGEILRALKAVRDVSTALTKNDFEGLRNSYAKLNYCLNTVSDEANNRKLFYANRDIENFITTGLEWEKNKNSDLNFIDTAKGKTMFGKFERGLKDKWDIYATEKGIIASWCLPEDSVNVSKFKNSLYEAFDTEMNPNASEKMKNSAVNSVTNFLNFFSSPKIYEQMMKQADIQDKNYRIYINVLTELPSLIREQSRRLEESFNLYYNYQFELVANQIEPNFGSFRKDTTTFNDKLSSGEVTALDTVVWYATAKKFLPLIDKFEQQINYRNLQLNYDEDLEQSIENKKAQSKEVNLSNAEKIGCYLLTLEDLKKSVEKLFGYNEIENNLKTAKELKADNGGVLTQKEYDSYIRDIVENAKPNEIFTQEQQTNIENIIISQKEIIDNYKDIKDMWQNVYHAENPYGKVIELSGVISQKLSILREKYKESVGLIANTKENDDATKDNTTKNLTIDPSDINYTKIKNFEAELENCNKLLEGLKSEFGISKTNQCKMFASSKIEDVKENLNILDKLQEKLINAHAFFKTCNPQDILATSMAIYANTENPKLDYLKDLAKTYTSIEEYDKQNTIVKNFPNAIRLSIEKARGDNLYSFDLRRAVEENEYRKCKKIIEHLSALEPNTLIREIPKVANQLSASNPIEKLLSDVLTSTIASNSISVSPDICEKFKKRGEKFLDIAESRIIGNKVPANFSNAIVKDIFFEPDKNNTPIEKKKNKTEEEKEEEKKEKEEEDKKLSNEERWEKLHKKLMQIEENDELYFDPNEHSRTEVELKDDEKDWEKEENIKNAEHIMKLNEEFEENQKKIDALHESVLGTEKTIYTAPKKNSLSSYLETSLESTYKEFIKITGSKKYIKEVGIKVEGLTDQNRENQLNLISNYFNGLLIQDEELTKKCYFKWQDGENNTSIAWIIGDIPNINEHLLKLREFNINTDVKYSSVTSSRVQKNNIISGLTFDESLLEKNTKNGYQLKIYTPSEDIEKCVKTLRSNLERSNILEQNGINPKDAKEVLNNLLTVRRSTEDRNATIVELSGIEDPKINAETFKAALYSDSYTTQLYADYRTPKTVDVDFKNTPISEELDNIVKKQAKNNSLLRNAAKAKSDHGDI